MKTKTLSLIALSLALACLAIYLFISAPPPLAENRKTEKNTYSIQEAFTIIAELNDAARTFYTKEIVGKGKAVGLKFDEDWRKIHIDAGPLPALFLRSTGSYIEKSPVPLGLYLGSDFPIVEANLFEGVQAEKFKEIRKDNKAKFFYDADTDRHIGMFPDYAGANACVSCHNEHKDSPKKDWELNDIMGATTWSYPKDSLSTDELIAMINIYKAGVSHTFETYLTKTKGFKRSNKPNIGNKWPTNGYFLPSTSVLNDTVAKLTSKKLLESILKTTNEK